MKTLLARDKSLHEKIHAQGFPQTKSRVIDEIHEYLISINTSNSSLVKGNSTYKTALCTDKIKKKHPLYGQSSSLLIEDRRLEVHPPT